MAGTIRLNQDFKEFIQSLNNHEVQYLVVGGYAVAIHGHPRYTKDIDIWLRLDKQNAQKVVAALEEFGFGSLGLRAEDFLDINQIIQLGYPPNRIDLLTTLPGVDFEDSYVARVQILIEDVLVDCIDLHNLRKNKQASGRLQDLADLENLQ